MQEVKLKPCPFCGSEDVELNSYLIGNKYLFFVTDTECLADGPVFGTEEEAIAAWNRRTPENAHARPTASPQTE